METILIAGGTGLIGKHLQQLWTAAGHEVRLLTRGASNPQQNRWNWDPEKGTMDETALQDVTVLVNLCGAGIGDKRWTAVRKKELYDSRVGTTQCLFRYAQHSTTLRHYISASGAVCYGFDHPEKVYEENDPFGTDLLSHLTRVWEQAADAFSAICAVSKIRISVVLAKESGALPVIAAPIKKGFGCVLGDGKQIVPWIHIEDLARQFDHVLSHRLEGVYHACAGNTDNATLTHTIAQVLGKKIRLPKAPGWALKLVLGEMSVVVLKGVRVSSEKIHSTGLVYRYTDLTEALKAIYARE